MRHLCSLDTVCDQIKYGTWITHVNKYDNTFIMFINSSLIMLFFKILVWLYEVVYNMWNIEFKIPKMQFDCVSD